MSTNGNISEPNSPTHSTLSNIIAPNSPIHNVTGTTSSSNILYTQNIGTSSNILNFTLNETIIQDGDTVTNQQGLNNSNIAITHTKFIDTNSLDVVDINADLLGTAFSMHDDEKSGPSSGLYSQIK